MALSTLSTMLMDSAMLPSNEKKQRGGIRIGAGVKPKFSEPSKYVQTLVPLSKVAIFKAKAKELTDNWIIKQQ